ncbi:hypothetical protein C464_12975 [Halorubrum coriense DSM 10284]|uniref:Flippase-like domain-containing protein n=1 Tax=Halorubrum coriense DSM 10284 TaxID=1227466 RepID=M0EAX5_9EURY|nr:hypothetical protein C464_12975 [Halorubrum coriense DSM 10284]
MEQVQSQKYVTTILKLLITSLAILYLIRIIPVTSVISHLSGLGRITAFILVLAIIGQKLFSTLSLYTLVREATDTRFLTIIEIDAIGYVTNSVIPTKAGAVLSVPTLLRQYLGISLIDGGRIKATQFVYSATYQGIFAVMGLALTISSLDSKLLPIYSGSSALYISLPILAIVASRWRSSIVPYLPKILTRYSSRSGQIKFSKKTLVIVSIFTLGYFTMVPIRFYLISNSYSIHFTWIGYLTIPMLAYSVTIYPISFGGIGVAEASGTMLLIALGVPPEIAAPIIVTDRIVSAYIPLTLSGVIAAIGSIRSEVN